jgi:pyruvate/2-oxoacid:ferredoxin oxidoreductase alpha subunit
VSLGLEVLGIYLERSCSPQATVSALGAGPVALEVIASLHRMRVDLDIVNYVAGIGGRPVTESDFKGMLELALKLGRRARELGTLYWGVRGVNYE